MKKFKKIGRKRTNYMARFTLLTLSKNVNGYQDINI